MIFDKLRDALERPRAALWAIAVGTLLVLPSLSTGLAADDHLHRLILDGSRAIAGLERDRLDLFHFASPEHNRALMEEGVFPWWADPEVRFAFWRPLAALTHALDHALWPGSAVMMHAHNILWLVASAIAAWGMYRRVLGATWVAALALLLYVVDDARGAPVAWVANRNALIAAALSIGAFVAFHRGRESGSPVHRVLGPLAFGAGLLASAGAAAIGGYLLAYALFLEKAKGWRRFTPLLPYGAVLAAWSAASHGLGYGIRGSGVYFDPAGEPALFLSHLPERALALFFSQLGGPWSEWSNVYGILLPGLDAVMLVLAVAFLAAMGVVFAPLLRKSATARFWVAGAALAVIPSCAAFPADRLLPWVGLGAFGAVAELMADWAEARGRGLPRWRRASQGAVAWGAVGVHLVLAPLGLPMRSRGIAQVREAIERADRTIPADEAVTRQTVIYVNPPADPFASYIPVVRAIHGTPRPRAQRWLATGVTAMELEREDARTLRVRPEGGFLIAPSERLLRRRPFDVGERVTLSEMTVEVTAVTADGRPAEARIRFDRELEDPSLRWLVWRGSRYEPFDLPEVGEARHIPAVNLLRVAYGDESVVSRLWL